MLDRRLVEDVASRLRTDTGLVEKDWHVVRAIGVLGRLDHGPVRLAFSGGTSLSKAWGLIKRFSEDIDFKVAMPPAPSAAKGRLQRSLYRELILGALTAADFELAGRPAVSNESRFFSADLAYPTGFGSGRGLRPHLRIEMTFGSPALPPIARPIGSLIAAAKGETSEVPAFACVDPVETAAEKLSALAWRVGSRRRGEAGDDPAVIRHLHDLAAIAPQARASPQFGALVRQAAAADAGRGTGGAPADIAGRFGNMLERLRSDPLWAREYEEFVRQVSFAEPGEVPSFDDALAATTRLIAGLAQGS
ncbi:MAG: nucleotidyl transferase AbiEii/AbiGii toxin family protein [Dongiaceae bacterium]